MAIEGTSITYCYIRKNGCSAFKRLMLDLAGYSGPWDDGLGVMRKNFAVSSINEARDADWRVYVYRDPFSRAVSLFRNKMIMTDGAGDLLRDFAEVTGSDPADATFSTFVRDYLDGQATDPHAWSQISHVLPMDYNVICTLDTLGAKMTDVLGAEVAGKYFVRRANASSRRLFDKPSADVPVRELRERYTASQEMPSDDAFATESLRRIIQNRYCDDYALSPNRQAGRRDLSARITRPATA
ncbi:sulfotransferase family 2 domain-containing protein [Sphingomonas sp.]|uniref:sulfotransferase family 2 domain-containing protein n=1 Tax=Sphingomonas sp. TaxID=28214 RepID=UPI0025FC9685|nr:sulfotransferase family 2 domain-containing protein [Sphingomonas sp.]MBV9527256.1 sulfotransferase family 2 domain-containing protein [Sphingomonas sp.]